MPTLTASVDAAWKILLVALAALLGATIARASDPGDQTDLRESAPSELVKEALFQEILGQNDERAELLRKALEADEEFAPALWAQGNIRVNRQWKPADEAMEQLKDDRRLVEYRFRRDKAEATVESQRDLADWCERRGLEPQERAHLNRVLEFNPDHPQARQRLGFRRIGNRWVSQEEIASAFDKMTTESENLKAWRKPMMRLRGRLLNPSPSVREHAQEELAAIDDPSAIVAMEILLCGQSEPMAKLGMDAIATFNEPTASEALARLSIISAWESIRTQAADHLKQRDRIEFVPGLVAELELPARTATMSVRTNNGLLHREMLLTEDRENQRVSILDTRYRQVALPGSDNQETLNRMANDMQNNVQLTRANLANVNLQRARDNDVICDALRRSTGQDIENDPQAWWDWWDDELGVSRPQKGQQFDYQTRNISVLGSPQSNNPDSRGDVSQSTPSPRSYECLAAGTPVWTDRGPVAIEQVQVGDMVLGQNVSSGAVELRPVLVTTTRPPSELVEIQLADETIKASQGHPFWVAGEGWVLAKNLEAGMVLHGQKGGVTILGVETGQTAETYNLVVEELKTYFAGESRVLGHDFTSREPAPYLLPGLER